MAIIDASGDTPIIVSEPAGPYYARQAQATDGYPPHAWLIFRHGNDGKLSVVTDLDGAKTLVDGFNAGRVGFPPDAS